MPLIDNIVLAATELSIQQPAFTPREVIALIRQVNVAVPLNEGTVRCQFAMYCVNAHPSHDGFTDQGANWKRRPLFVKVKRGFYRLYDPAVDADLYVAEVARDAGGAAVPAIAPPNGAADFLPVEVRHEATVRHIVDGLNRYSHCLTLDPAHRYCSWDHCFDYFHTLKHGHQPGVAIPDVACVHLAFYLASWGMYRGNAFLLQKDYTVMRPVVKILLSQQYSVFWQNDEMTLPRTQWLSRAKLAMELAAEIAGELRLVSYVNSRGVQRQANPSMTLVTKIMLGTMGCIPAYDRYVITGLKREKLIPASAGVRSYLKLLAALNAYSADLNLAAAHLGRFHPPMKLMDMWLWERGR